MERLTFDGNFCDVSLCAATPGGSYCEDGACTQRRVWERLKAYEDTCLMPEDLTAACSIDALTRVLARAYNVDPDDLREACLALKEGRYIIMRDAEQEGVARLRELSKADCEGRVVVLPCKVGDTVYVIDKGDYKHNYQPFVRWKTVYEISCKQNKYGRCLDWGVCLGPGDCGTIARYRLDKLGKSWFVTCAEAEAALEAIDHA